VAAEVRSLAQRSAQAAKEIKTLINDSVDKCGDGAHLVSITGAKLEGIVSKVKHVAELISEINAASQEQASGIDQVNRAIVHMDGVTQSNAAQVEELTGTSQSLAVQAEHLRQLAAEFKVASAKGAPSVRSAPAVAAVEPIAASAMTSTSIPVDANKPAVLADKPNVKALRPRRATGGTDGWAEF
jgi:methyl-accepting chemotaxis protein